MSSEQSSEIVREQGRRGGAGRRQLRRGALYVFFFSVTVNAAFGIYALLVPGFGETEGKVLATSFCVTGALVLALLCAPAWDRRVLGPLPPLGALVGASGFVLVAVAVWIEPEGDRIPKSIGTLLIPAGAIALTCLLALAPLPQRLRALFPLEIGLIAAVVSMILIGIWAEIDSGWYLRALGVVSVALAALTVTIPVLHRVGQVRGRVDALGADVAFCPFCGGAVNGAMAAAVTCQRCDRSFTVVGGRMPDSDPFSS